MKTTTTLMDILQGELHRSGKSEFYQKNHIEWFNDDYAFIQKVLKYDPDVQTIVDRIFFRGFKFGSKNTNDKFKKAFIVRFLNREIAFQTVEIFSARVLSKCLAQETYITECFDNLADFIHDRQLGTTHSQTDSTSNTKTNNTSNSNGTSNSDGSNQSDNRTLQSDLPSNNVNLNIDDTVLDYGNQNNISRDKVINYNNNETTNDSESNGTNDQTGQVIGNGQTTSEKADINSLHQANQLIEEILDDFDRDCFLQIW